MKRNILLLVRWPVGGIRTFIRYVYTNFDRSRYRFTLMAPDLPELRVLLEDLRGLELTYKPFDFRIGNIARLVKTLSSGELDLVHSHGFTSGMYAALPARLWRIPHIMTSHDVLGSKQFDGMRGLLRKRSLNMVLPAIDVIHSVSHDAHMNLLGFVPALRRKPETCIVIPNGIEVERFSSDESRDFRAELGLSDDAFLIGFLGRFMSQKGFIYLVESIEMLTRQSGLARKPVVLSFGAGGFIEESRNLVRQKGLAQYFHFLDFAPNIAPALRGLDVVAMPSLWEACGLLAMEAMVAGVPLIGTDCIGLREVLAGTPCRRVPSGDSLALAEALKHEMSSPSRAAMEAFRPEASSRFDVRRQATALERLIISLMTTGPVSSLSTRH